MYFRRMNAIWEKMMPDASTLRLYDGCLQALSPSALGFNLT
jgi:hypothetical protein